MTDDLVRKVYWFIFHARKTEKFPAHSIVIGFHYFLGKCQRFIGENSRCFVTIQIHLNYIRTRRYQPRVGRMMNLLSSTAHEEKHTKSPRVRNRGKSKQMFILRWKTSRACFTNCKIFKINSLQHGMRKCYWPSWILFRESDRRLYCATWQIFLLVLRKLDAAKIPFSF